MGVGFVDPPEPDPAQTFHFVWHQPGPGPHTLMARATDNRGAVGPSPAVGIHVGPSDLLPFVTVTAHDSFAVEPGLEETVETAAFRIHRFGSDAEPLVVAYSLGGSAQNGTDYQELSGLATIPAGMPSVEVVVRPLGDALSEGVETVVLQLAPSPAPSPQIPESNSYQIGQPWAAAAVISDTQLAPVPGVAQLAALPNNLLHLCFAAETGQAYRLEASTDLLTWETLSDTVSTNNACHFIDPEMSNHPLRFYRLAPE